jgi:hypothetical protein
MIRPPHQEPGVGGNILSWAREAQQTFRDIDRALRSLPLGGKSRRPEEVFTQARALQSLELVNTGTSESRKIRVVGGTIAGELPTGMSPGDDPVFELTGLEDSGYVLAKVSFTSSTGEVTNREIIKSSDVPGDEDGVIHIVIGSWSIDEDDVMHLSNARYGPIDLMICRDWYASPPHYSVNLA